MSETTIRAEHAAAWAAYLALPADERARQEAWVWARRRRDPPHVDPAKPLDLECAIQKIGTRAGDWAACRLYDSISMKAWDEVHAVAERARAVIGWGPNFGRPLDSYGSSLRDLFERARTGGLVEIIEFARAVGGALDGLERAAEATP